MRRSPFGPQYAGLSSGRAAGSADVGPPRGSSDESANTCVDGDGLWQRSPVLVGANATGQQPSKAGASGEDEVTKKARAIHERVMTLDTHNDIEPGELHLRVATTRSAWATRSTCRRWSRAASTPLSSSSTSARTGADASRPRATTAPTSGDREVRRDPPADRADRARQDRPRAHGRRRAAHLRSGKKVAFIGVENGYPIGEDIARVKEFYDRGARYMSLAHNGHSQLSDSNTGERNEWKWNGLSPLGKQVIAEMNESASWSTSRTRRRGR